MEVELEAVFRDEEHVLVRIDVTDEHFVERERLLTVRHILRLMRRDDLREQLLFVKFVDDVLELSRFFFGRFPTRGDLVIRVARFRLDAEVAVDDDDALDILIV